jgi:hypothetical protein
MKRSLNGKLWPVHACGAACVLAVTAGGVALGVRPAVERTRELSDMITSVNDRDQRVRAAEANRTSAMGLDKKLSGDLDKAVRLMPHTRINERLADLTARAEKRNVKVEQITPGNPTMSARATAVPIRLSGSCVYTDITRLLRELHADYRDMVLVNLQVIGQPAAAGEKAACVAEFVWFAAPAASAAAGAP